MHDSFPRYGNSDLKMNDYRRQKTFPGILLTKILNCKLLIRTYQNIFELLNVLNHMLN